jgi:hypothetical protein
MEITAIRSHDHRLESYAGLRDPEWKTQPGGP